MSGHRVIRRETTPTRWRRASATVAGWLLSTLFLLPAPCAGQEGAAEPAGGYRLTMAAVSSVGASKGGAGVSNEVTYQLRLRDGVLRIDFASGASPTMPAGAYMLLDSRTAGMRVVNPEARAVIAMNAMESLSAMEDMAELTMTDTSSALEDLGPGERMLGFATHRYRLTMGYTMRMAMFGQRTAIQSRVVHTMLVSEEVAALDPAFELFRTNIIQSSTQRMSGRAGAAIAALAALQPTGFIMASEQETRVSQDGREQTTTRTWRVTDFARGGVRSTDMVVPADYTVNDLTATMRKRMNAEGAGSKQVPAKPVKPLKGVKP